MQCGSLHDQILAPVLHFSGLKKASAAAALSNSIIPSLAPPVASEQKSSQQVARSAVHFSIASVRQSQPVFTECRI